MTPSLRKLTQAAVGLFCAAGVSAPAAASAQPPCRPDPAWEASPLREPPALPPAQIFAPVGASEFDPALAEQLDLALAQALQGAPGGAAAVLTTNGALWTGVAGVPADGVLQAASITKIATAAVVLKLVEAGKLSLDTSLAEFYPQLPNAELVTIDHLLRHTSGLHLDDAERLTGEFVPREAELVRLAAADPLFCPGTRHAYSNVGYRLLGGVIEKVEGTSYAEAVDAHVVRPLGLTATFVRRAGAPDPRIVSAHHAGAPVGAVEYATPGAAGALASTPAELARMWRAVLNGELVSHASRDLMFKPLADMYAPPSIAYGRGAMVFHQPGAPTTVYGHTGQITGFSTALYYFVQEGAIVVVMVNDRTHSSEDLLGRLHEVLQARPKP